MITATALEIISGAAQDLGILALGQELSGPEGADALDLLNLVADALGIEQGLLFRLVRTTKTLASGTSSYTVGTAGSIALARPPRLAKAGLILDTGASVPLEVKIDVLTDEKYAEWPDKTAQAARSTAVFYNRGFDGDGYGTLYPLPIPNVGTTQLVLYTPGGAVSSFATLATEYEFAEGLALVLRTQFALQLAAVYPQAVVTPRYAARAGHLKRTFKAAHQVVPERETSPLLTGRGGRFDMNTGGWR